MAEWIKMQGRTAWSIEFVPVVWDICIARDSIRAGKWRMTGSPGDNSYSIYLDCEDDLEAAQAAALRRVAADASDRIKSDTEIRDAALMAAGLPAQTGTLTAEIERLDREVEAGITATDDADEQMAVGYHRALVRVAYRLKRLVSHGRADVRGEPPSGWFTRIPRSTNG